MDTDPDVLLVRDLSSADPQRRRSALGALYDRHSGRVFNVALRVLGDWQQAQDVTQEVFLRLARKGANFRGDASFTSWLYRITVNRAIDSRRRQVRRPVRLLGETPAEAVPVHRRSESAEDSDALVESERARRVQEALLVLSPALRAVVVLRYLEGLSYHELAEALNCSLGTIKSRLNRAHRMLGRLLADLEPPSSRDGDT